MRTPVVAVKMAILFYSARLFGYCHGRDAGLFAVALSQVGEFAFVLFTAAANVLPPTTIALLNAVVATSMVLVRGLPTQPAALRSRDRRPT